LPPAALQENLELRAKLIGGQNPHKFPVAFCMFAAAKTVGHLGIKLVNSQQN